MKKGSKMSKEARLKISKSNKGKVHSEEIKRKISVALKGKTPKNIEILLQSAKRFKKGQIPWNKGKMVDRTKFPNMGHFQKNSEETRRKISGATKRAMANPKIRKKISESKKGKPTWNKGIKTGISPWIKGKRHSENSKKIMTLAVKKRVANPNFLKKLKKIHNIRLSNPEEKERQSKVSRETILGLYESGSFPRQTNTKPERQIKDELIKRGYKEGTDFIHQYKFNNKFMCDFCFPEQKVVVEVYGDFWHANPKKYAGKELHKHQIKGINRDKSKEAYITKCDNGSWTYLALWKSDIKENVSKCVDRIEGALRKAK